MKGFYWTGLTTFFGLLQLIILAGFEALGAKNKFDFVKVLLECSLVFFSTALVAGVAIDGFMVKRLFKATWKTGVFLALFPSVIIAISIVVYLRVKNHSVDPINVSLVQSTQITILSFSIIYAIGVKMVQFSKKGS